MNGLAALFSANPEKMGARDGHAGHGGLEPGFCLAPTLSRPVRRETAPLIAHWQVRSVPATCQRH